MVVNVFFEKKTQKPRHKERSPNRDHKHQYLAQRNVQGADYQVRRSAASVFVINGVRSSKKFSVRLNHHKKVKNSATPQIRR